MKRTLFPALVAGGAAASTLLAACFPSFTFGGSAQGDAGDATVASDQSSPLPDGASSDTSSPGNSNDAGGDAALGAIDAEAGGTGSLVEDAGSCEPTGLDAAVGPVPVTIVPQTQVATAAGLGQQMHLVTQADCSSRYFYVSDDGATLLSSTSSDFVTWTAADEIALPGNLAYGDDFSVAYARINGQDVVHLVVDVGATSGLAGTYHLRTTVSNGRLTIPQAALIAGTQPNGACLQDGPAVIVTGDGRVVDATGWTSHASTSCDTNVYFSTAVDDGTAFDLDAGFALNGYFVSYPSYDFTHQLVELPQAGAVLVGFPDQDTGDQDTEFQALGAQISPFDAGYATVSNVELFFSADKYAWFSDYGLCRQSDTEVHAIRHVMSSLEDASAPSAFQAMVYGGPAIGWQSEGTPPSSASPGNLGLAVVSARDPSHGLIVATVGPDGQSIALAKRSTSGTWTSLPTIARATAIQSLAGTGCGASRPAIFWTEGTAGAYAIVAADLSGQLQ